MEMVVARSIVRLGKNQKVQSKNCMRLLRLKPKKPRQQYSKFLYRTCSVNGTACVKNQESQNGMKEGIMIRPVAFVLKNRINCRLNVVLASKMVNTGEDIILVGLKQWVILRVEQFGVT